MVCPDPIEVMLAAADRHGAKFFVSSDWYGEWDAQALPADGTGGKRSGLPHFASGPRRRAPTSVVGSHPDSTRLYLDYVQRLKR